ncbi:MAG: dihydropteroate synthase [Gemmatimonadales bacterium]|jgi:dihydropteroate synthase
MLWRHATGTLSLDRPRILGIVNVTPDSFSDGGHLRTVDDACRYVERLVGDGADVVDVGGESTRPQNAEAVDVDEERRRVLPVIEAIVARFPDVPVSVDTVKSPVARDALACGASIVNDVSAFRLDDEMATVCASNHAGVVLMHSRGGVMDMATFAHATYGGDVAVEVLAELTPRVEQALAAGVARESIIIDPGLGFSKRGAQSIAVLSRLELFTAVGFPVLVGPSRKRFVGEITGVADPAKRAAGTVGACVAALDRGALLFRVHDVKPARDALDVAWAIRRSAPA